MADNIVKKKYYKIIFELASPLAIGSGDNENTDKDLIRDANGCPYIPASSVAGVIRDILSKTDEKKADFYLGDVKINRGNNGSEYISESRIIFYDATIITGHVAPKPRVTVRDSVALDEYKTAKKGAKFDMEVLEPGVQLVTFIEQNYFSENDEDYGMYIAKAFLYDRPVFGGKSMRGYGTICNTAVFAKTFDLSRDVADWLEFDIYDTRTIWDGCELPDKDVDNVREITLQLKLKGGISIRRYTTKVSKGESSEPDMEQLTVGEDQIPVIPGTSWAGAVSHRMEEFGIRDSNKEAIFGSVNESKAASKARSKISFSESRISGGNFKIISRNSIDRFTGGTVDGALYTEKTYYGGLTELKIGWHSDEAMEDSAKKALAATLADLHYGFLAVGGETSVGRGIFTIKEIDGKNVPEAQSENSREVYHMILNNIEEVFG